MKRIAVLIIGMVLMGATVVAAQAADKVTNTRILQATKDTTITYAGVKVFIPAGQTVVLGQSSDGSMILRGQNLNGVKVGEGTLACRGTVLLSIQPDTQVIRVVQGSNVFVKDGNGRTAEVSAGAAVSAKDIRLSVEPPAEIVRVVEEERVVVVSERPSAKPSVNDDEEEDDTTALPAFVAAGITSEVAAEQAAQDVEDTLSPSVPH